ncbi:hypothetical protein EDC94DRAFT_579809 [Helicostylum pulchrum]|nr:hypothetical protein EDC94DRAFT_579809 [Helicostylum pulchrum]
MNLALWKIYFMTGHKKNVLISLDQSLKNTVYFVCCHSRYKSLKPDRNAKRQSSSHKTGCPFILRITYKDLHNFWSLNEPKNEMEYTHNHPCTAAYNSVSPFGKKELTTQQDIKTIASMPNNNSKVTEIMKNISKFNGYPS